MTENIFTLYASPIALPLLEAIAIAIAVYSWKSFCRWLDKKEASNVATFETPKGKNANISYVKFYQKGGNCQ